MIFTLKIKNIFVKNIVADTIQNALEEIPEMNNPEIFVDLVHDNTTMAYQVVDGEYYELKEFVYTITYHFFRVGNIVVKEYTDKSTADYWFGHFCNDPNYSSVTKNW